MPGFSLSIVTSLPHQTMRATPHYWNRSGGCPLRADRRSSDRSDDPEGSVCCASRADRR